MPKIQVLTFPHIIPLSFKFSKKENNKKLLSTYVTKNNDMTKKLVMAMLFKKRIFSFTDKLLFLLLGKLFAMTPKNWGIRSEAGKFSTFMTVLAPNLNIACENLKIFKLF